jgi:arginase
MTMKRTINQLQIIGVRYVNATYYPGDRIPLASYAEAGIYDAAEVPYEIVEPYLDEHKRTTDEIQNVGNLGGLIADEVALARRNGRAVCMTGGNCCHITGVIGGLQDAHGAGIRIGLVWFDAHGDFNTTKTTLSGMLGGMPVAVAAGLTHNNWREASHIVAPLSTDRIILVDVRNLDPAEEQLIRATDTVIASIATGFSGDIALKDAVEDLADRVDLIYCHIDSDILDESYTPNHGTKEPDGPDMDQVLAAIDMVMATRKVAAYAVVSVSGEGESSEVMVNSGKELIRGGLASWKKYGMA